MQFSIRAILALTLVAGGICGLLFGVPDEYLPYALLAPWCVLPGALVSALVYGRGYVRAFAIGGLPIAVPAAVWALAVTASAGDVDADNAKTLRILFVSGAAIILLAGATSAAIRWVLMPQRAARTLLPSGDPPIGSILTGRIAAHRDGAAPLERPDQHAASATVHRLPPARWSSVRPTPWASRPPGRSTGPEKNPDDVARHPGS